MSGGATGRITATTASVSDTVAEVVDAARAAGLPGTALSVAVRVPGAADVRLHRGTTGHADGAAVTDATLFDLASLTKVFVAVAALRLCEDGVIELDAPVAPLVAVGRGDRRGSITLRHLLTHSAGLPASSTLWRSETDADRLLERVLTTPLHAPPGCAHTYSCLGYIAAGRALEVATGRPLDQVVERHVLEPLGARTARFGPVRSSPGTPSTVATEVQPARGLVHGEVHDELAHALARPVGNAGLFGTADDVLALGELLLRDGRGRSGHVLSAATSAALRRPLAGLPPGRPPYGQAIGFRVGDRTFMGGIRGLGHTGFTGTSLVVDPTRRTVTVLLTNRVHPTREGVDVGPLRRALVDAVATVADEVAG